LKINGFEDIKNAINHDENYPLKTETMRVKLNLKNLELVSLRDDKGVYQLKKANKCY